MRTLEPLGTRSRSGANSSRRVASGQGSRRRSGSVRSMEASFPPRARRSSSGASHSSSRASSVSSSIAGHGSARWWCRKARRRRSAAAASLHVSNESLCAARAFATACRATSGVGDVGVAENSIAPSALTRRPTILPEVASHVARTSSTSRCDAASSAIGRVIGAANRMTAPVPRAARPSERATSATANHSHSVNGESSSPARVPDAVR